MSEARFEVISSKAIRSDGELRAFFKSLLVNHVDAETAGGPRVDFLASTLADTESGPKITRELRALALNKSVSVLLSLREDEDPVSAD